MSRPLRPADRRGGKRYIPLESNPEVFTQLINTLGTPSLKFQDVYSVDEPDLLALISRPVYALVLVFPTTQTYKAQVSNDEAARKEYKGSGPEEDVIWFKQTIYNACGLYGILHAVSNGDARAFIESGSVLQKLLIECEPLAPDQRALALEASKEIEAAHAAAAHQGDSAVPNLEDEVDYHYLAFARSYKTGHVFELDGDKKGPIDTGIVLNTNQDLLSESVLGLLRGYLHRDKDDPKFNLLALVPA